MGCGECKDAKWSIYLSSTENLDIVKEIMVDNIGYTKFQTTLLLVEVRDNINTPIFTGLHDEALKVSDIFIKKNIDITLKKDIY